MSLDLRTQPLAFVDIETTGSTGTRDRITEVAVVTYDGETRTQWTQLVNPETSIPPFIEGLTGISNDMVADQPVFRQVADELFTRLQGHTFVAHNARFDYGFIKNEFKRIGVDFRATVLCTVKLSRKLYPKEYKHNLDMLIARHQLTLLSRHRALGDADALYQFWQIIQRDFPPETLADAVKALTARPSLPTHLDGNIVDELPTSHGVYLFYGEEHILLYVGKSNNIRTRVLSHFSSDHAIAKEMALSQQVRDIEWITCSGEVEALLLESRLVKEKQPTLNRQLRRNGSYVAWRLNTDAAGWLIPETVSAKELHLGQQASIYGLYSGATAAKTALLSVVKDNKLCAQVLGLEKKPKSGEQSPCFARQLQQCKGACVGHEPMLQHNMRLMQALGKLKLKSWPFPGPAALNEGKVVHLIDAWCYLGTARTESEVHTILAEGKPQFDRDTYKILLKHLNKMRAI
jgi:DNA polymerase III subunit epsilon